MDQYALTVWACQIVAEAAQASTHIRVTRIDVDGYTDNSAARPAPAGRKYNSGLSVRRAQSVKAELIRDGVPVTAIDIHGYRKQIRLSPQNQIPVNPKINR